MTTAQGWRIELRPVPGIEAGKRTANGRVYTEDTLSKLVEDSQECIRQGHMTVRSSNDDGAPTIGVVKALELRKGRLYTAHDMLPGHPPVDRITPIFHGAVRSDNGIVSHLDLLYFAPFAPRAPAGAGMTDEEYFAAKDAGAKESKLHVLELPTLADVNEKVDKLKKDFHAQETGTLSVPPPHPFMCIVCGKWKDGLERAAGGRTDNQGPVMCDQCAQNGLLWAAMQARAAEEAVLGKPQGTPA